ncbi:hypothetical protein FOL86_00915 [Lactobacillus reuteri]|uniref:hypothetical protein n=1 Tax=Limosilactobacillus reuteri TaxID=1598 RepID=UPI00146E196A|nr:hypothetical protein [Limosilactobacillus reuteri]NMV51764.1 hypothetical protein [Limosilactobacillus reuteri]
MAFKRLPHGQHLSLIDRPSTPHDISQHCVSLIVLFNFQSSAYIGLKVIEYALAHTIRHLNPLSNGTHGLDTAPLQAPETKSDPA